MLKPSISQNQSHSYQIIGRDSLENTTASRLLARLNLCYLIPQLYNNEISVPLRDLLSLGSLTLTRLTDTPWSQVFVTAVLVLKTN